MLKQAFAAGLTLALLAILFSGCQESSYVPRYNAYRSPYENQSSSDRRSDTGNAARLLTEMQAHVSRNPSDLEGAQSYVYQIESAAPGSQIEASARRIFQTVRTRVESEAQARYKTALDRAKDLEDKGLYEKAMAVLEEFATNYRGTESADKASQERMKLANTRQAKSTYERFIHNADTFRAVGEYEQALEFIKKHKPDQQIKGTKYEAMLLLYIAKLTAEAEKSDVEKSRIDALPWEDLTKIDSRSWSSDGGLWKVESGRITGANPTRDYGRLILGENDWKNYILDMRFTIRGGALDLGVRGMAITEFRRRYKVFDITSGLKDSGTQIDMKVTVRGVMVSIESPSLSEARYKKILEPDGSYVHTYGPICLYLHRGAQVEFSKFKVKHLGKVAQPTAEK